VLLWGSPGTGKSSVVGALGESLGWPTEGVIGSIREPADFAGTGMHLGETFQIQTAWVLSVGS
jgi:predicted GTPase